MPTRHQWRSVDCERLAVDSRERLVVSMSFPFRPEPPAAGSAAAGHLPCEQTHSIDFPSVRARPEPALQPALQRSMPRDDNRKAGDE